MARKLAKKKKKIRRGFLSDKLMNKAPEIGKKAVCRA
jgi:hypothetical protein